MKYLFSKISNFCHNWTTHIVW